MQLIEFARDRYRIVAGQVKDLFSSVSSFNSASSVSGSQLFRGSSQLPPKRSTTEYLHAYNTMPWLRAVTGKVSWSIASTDWNVFAVRGGNGKFTNAKSVNRLFYHERRRKLAQLAKAHRLVEIEEHPLLDLLSKPNSRIAGVSGWQLTQTYLDLVGEAAWLIQPHKVLPIPEAIWQIPPHWVKSLPTSEKPFFRVELEDLDGRRQTPQDVPVNMLVWFSMPNPVNPYARGSGVAEALGDELETDEFTAKYIKAWFYNKAMPDILISGKGLNKDMNKRLERDWLKKNQGFWKAFKPYFLQGEDIKVDVLQQNFRNLEVRGLRQFERDTIIQVYGVPPEMFGILTSSNRATIEAADFLFARWVLLPRLEFMRAVLQMQLVPLYDDRIIVDYVSPIEEDKDFKLKVMQAAPWAFPMGEWRETAGFEPFGDRRDELHHTGLSDDFRTFSDAELNQMNDDRLNPPEPEPPDNGGSDDDDEEDEERRSEPHVIRSAPTLDAFVIDDPDALEAWHEEFDRETERRYLARMFGYEKAVGQGTRAFVELHRIARRLEPEFREAFRRSVNALGKTVNSDNLIAALRTGNAEQTLALFDDQAFSEAFGKRYQRAMRKTFRSGAEAARELLRGDNIPGAFDITNPEAVQWIESNTARLVTEVKQTTKAGLRKLVERGFVEGRNTAQLARDIKDFGVGMTERQANAVVNFRQRLVEQGASNIESRVDRYAKAQINFRAKNIARTETITAANGGQAETWRETQKRGDLPPGTEKQWLVTGDDRLDTTVCEPMDGQRRKLEESFETGLGTRVSHPTAHPMCVLPDTEITALGINAGLSASYSGWITEIHIDGVRLLAVGPNHPVLTTRGLVPAKRINEDDYVIGARWREWILPFIDPHEKNAPSGVEDIVQALRKSRSVGSVSVPASAHNLHGDGGSVNGEIEIIDSDGFLRCDANAAMCEEELQALLQRAHSANILKALASREKPAQGHRGAFRRRVRSLDLKTALKGRHALPLEEFGFALGSWFHAVTQQPSTESGSAYTKFLRQLVFGLACDVSVQRVSKTRRIWYSGHIYDLQSWNGLYIANGIVASNCRCSMRLVFP